MSWLGVILALATILFVLISSRLKTLKGRPPFYKGGGGGIAPF